MASITLKTKRLSNSEVIITSRGGERHVFGIINAGDISAIADTLAARYGAMLTRA